MYYEDVSPEFFQTLEIRERRNWVELYQCSSCGVFWRIDVYDKYQTRYVVRIENPTLWEQFDSQSLEKELLVNHRGGYLESNCSMKGCPHKKVKGSAYCVNHLFEYGVRK